MAEANTQAIIKARRFVRDIQRAGVHLDAAYLYGSFASGTANADSDIDVALVSHDLTGGLQDHEKLGSVLAANDNRIENVRFHPRDFRDENPLVWEIKAQGIPLIRPHPGILRKQRLNVNAILRYWQKTAAQDWKWASNFARDRRYDYALVFGRSYLEKLLKAVIVKQTRAHAPYRLPLVELAQLTQLEFDKSQLELLERVEGYTRERIEEPEHQTLRKKLSRKYALHELQAIHKLGKSLQAHAK